ncbi:ferrous iron transport protein B [archaeon]|nr:ferrous iron transport protein B [archaeon]
MHNHEKEVLRTDKKIAILGNPNVGKSVIFGLLTGKYVMVSNYPGTTVEVTTGHANFDKELGIIDTPGVNNLIPMSEDERVTRDILLNEDLDGLVQVIDAKNLRRGLLITLQLCEMGLPFLIDLNMGDEARSRGMYVDSKRLGDILGVRVVETVATSRKGISKLVKSTTKTKKSHFSFRYSPEIEEGAKKIAELIPEARIGKRSMALMLLSGDESLKPWLASLDAEAIKKIEQIRDRAQASYSQPLNYVITKRRLEEVHRIVKQTESREEKKAGSILESFGRLAVHPIKGIPILMAVLLLVYWFVGVFGAGTLVDFFEGVIFNEYINPTSTGIIERLIPSKLAQDFLIGDYGIITMALTYSVAIILPIVGTFFIAFGILEDSGYLPRLAVMVNRIFKILGLNGKAVLPMILGLGCVTMATLTARTLETKKERIIVTLLLALGVPCSAQLGVILGLLGGLSGAALAVWAGSVVTTLFVVGFLASKVIPGGSYDFIMELPPIRVPKLSNILIKTATRVEWYLKEAVPLFILGTIVLFTLDITGILGGIEIAASPLIVGVLGLPAQATGAFLIGFLRRDYGAAGLFALASAGLMDTTQIVVSMVTITLFMPCIANLFIIIKERGWKTAAGMVAFIFPTAFIVGGILNFILRYFEVML